MDETKVRDGVIVLDGIEHPIGDAHCKVCCHDERASPCLREGCSGIVHSAVIDEQEFDDGDYVWIHAFLCDQCGSTEAP